MILGARIYRHESSWILKWQFKTHKLCYQKINLMIAIVLFIVNCVCSDVIDNSFTLDWHFIQWISVINCSVTLKDQSLVDGTVFIKGVLSFILWRILSCKCFNQMWIVFVINFRLKNPIIFGLLFIITVTIFFVRGRGLNKKHFVV